MKAVLESTGKSVVYGTTVTVLLSFVPETPARMLNSDPGAALLLEESDRLEIG